MERMDNTLSKIHERKQLKATELKHGNEWKPC